MSSLRLFHKLKYFSGSAAFSKMPSMERSNIVWVDLEMSGLDIEKHHILEVACIITDAELNVIAEGPDIIIKQDITVLQNMNEWCLKKHAETGLTDACMKSMIDLKTAENEILGFVKTYTPKGQCPLAGNSIYVDRMFLQKYMPEFNSHLHYRNIDVSSVKELCLRWYPQIYDNMPPKKLEHRALSDIQESISEMIFYKNNLFKNKVMT